MIYELDNVKLNNSLQILKYQKRSSLSGTVTIPNPLEVYRLFLKTIREESKQGRLDSVQAEGYRRVGRKTFVELIAEATQ